MAAARLIKQSLTLPVLAIGLVALCFSAPANASPKLKVGVGRADITPPTGYYMMGWVRSDAKIIGQNTRLWARVIVLRQGSRAAAGHRAPRRGCHRELRLREHVAPPAPL
ncbi:MAG TPA: hypothetical protein VKA90_04515 [Beijerinckiaceae bacterium]|nr:hypothetical protein [Beijerinckiaceae bacterium]